MNESASSSAESSLLLWGLAAVVAVLAAHVCLGWVREAQRHPTLRQSWLALLIASSTLGSGIFAATVLSLSAQALNFALGYRMEAAPLLWLAAMAASLPIAAVLMISRRPLAAIGAGVLVAALAALTQAGGVWAVGFRPGLSWRIEWVAMAVFLMIVGVATAIWLAFSSIGQEGVRRQLWRLGAAVLFGLSITAGQELLMTGAGLLTQVSSFYEDNVPATVLCLVAGAALPLLMTVMALDLEMRRRPIVKGQRRRRRSHRSRGA